MNRNPYLLICKEAVFDHPSYPPRILSSDGSSFSGGRGRAQPCLPDRNTITMSFNMTEYDVGAGYMMTRPVVCTQQERYSGGFWYGEDPTTGVFTMYLLQFILMNVLSQTVYLLLRPLRQPRVICNVVAGIIVSPNVMGRWKILQKMLLPPEDLLLVRTVGLLSIMFYIFVLSVKTDLGVLWRNFKKASTIGFLSMLGSFIATLLLIYILELPGINKGFFNIALAMGLSVTRFANVAFTINELNIFSSELGQLAVSSTMASELLGWFWTIIGVHIHFPFRMLLSASFCLAILMFFYFVLRPGLSHIIRRTPEGKPVKESYILVLIIGSMVVGFLMCLIGSMLFGFFIFGLMIPHGPPLGATLVEKTESFISEVLFPTFFIAIGYSLNFSVLEAKATVEIFIVVIVVAVIKLVATGLSAYFLLNLPVDHSLLLGLLMNIKGPYDIYLFFLWIVSQKIDRQSFTALTVFEMLLSAVIIPWIDKFYNPHARLRATTGRNRRFFLTSPRDFELPVICCLCGEDDVPGFISLLETLNPTEASPMLVHAVHLNELVGHANPEIISFNKKRMTRTRSKGSYHIMRAFENFSTNYNGSVGVKTYSVVAAYKSMHEYICILAMQEFVPLIIIPFQANKQANPTERTAMRIVNRNVQAYSPCTVGLLVDKGIARIGQLLDHSTNIAVIFISGEDDREALALAIRMAGHSNTMVTLIRVVAINDEVESVEDEVEKKRDEALIEQFIAEQGRKEGDAYQEILVENAEQMMHQLRCSEGVYNLIVVGRKQRKTSLMSEDMMLDWSENPELGVLGDLITSADFFATTSVLVMQHFGDVNASVQNNQSDAEDGLFSLVFWA